MKNKVSLRVKIIVGVLFSIVILILVALQIMDIHIAVIIITVMVLVFMTRSFLDRKLKPEDERTRRLDYRAVAWSYQLTLILVCMYIMLDYYFKMVLSSLQLAGLILYFMIFSNLIIKFIFRKRSDVID